MMVNALGAFAIVGRLWQGCGVQVRLSGLVAREPLGTLVVPWEALAVEPPALGLGVSTCLRLTYVRPGLVRRRGFVGRRRLSVDYSEGMLLAFVIHHYLVHPERRAAIGTRDGYEQLFQTAFQQPAAA